MQRSPAANFLQTLKDSKQSLKDGHLSLDYGFFPTQSPMTEFPSSHRAWNEVIKRLPHEINKPSFRQFVSDIPLLATDPKSLPDAYLPLAATLLSVIACAFWNCRSTPEKPELPINIRIPWTEVSKRLDRSSLNMDIVDLFTNNWRLIDKTLPETQRFNMENMEVIVKTFATQAEKIFYLTFVEMTYRSHNLVRTVINAQDAIINQNNLGIKKSLLEILKILDSLAAGFLKANLNPNSKTFLDPLILAKSTSFFGLPGPGTTTTVTGAFSPIFLLLDIALGRKKFDSEIGQQIKQSFPYIPKVYQQFFGEISKISIEDYVQQSNDRELQSLYSQTLSRYAGKSGLLSLHRDKAAYGVLNVGTRIGRIQTVAGLVTQQAKPWVKISEELDKSREERPHFQVATLVDKKPQSGPSSRMKEVNLNAENHIYFTAGDHIEIVPTNQSKDINAVLSLLELPANHPIKKTPQWNEFFAKHIARKDILTGDAKLDLGLCLQYGNIIILSIDNIKKRLPSLLLPEMDKNTKFSLVGLIRHIKATQPEQLSHLRMCLSEVVTPLTLRSYSISSPSSHQFSDKRCPFAMGLTVTKTAYPYPNIKSAEMHACPGQGVGSQFLTQINATPSKTPINIHPSYRFRLPEDIKKPIVLIAIGSGIAPLKAFYRQNAAQKEGREIHLFYGVKTCSDIISPEELQQIAKDSTFKYRISTSQEGEKKRIDQVIAEDYAKFMYDMIKNNASFYVCGNSQFVTGIQEIIIKIIAANKFAELPDALYHAKKYFYQHVAPNQFFTQEFFSQDMSVSYPQMYASEVCLHNNFQQGYWTIIKGDVYNMTDYTHAHPGGHYLLQLNAGIDATDEFEGVHVHVDSANAMNLAQQYKVGTLVQPTFRNKEDGQAYEKLTAFLSIITAYQNLMAIDYYITSNADYYWLLKAIEAHDRFNHFVRANVLSNLENIKTVLTELDSPVIERFLSKLAVALGFVFPYEKNKFGDVINTADNDEKITHTVYRFFKQVSQADNELLVSLKSGIKSSIDKLISERSPCNEDKPGKSNILRAKL